MFFPSRRGFSNHGAYSLSKLAVMLFTAELAARVGPGPPTVNTLDPGTVNTKMLYAGWGPCGIDVRVCPVPCALYHFSCIFGDRFTYSSSTDSFRYGDIQFLATRVGCFEIMSCCTIL